MSAVRVPAAARKRLRLITAAAAEADQVVAGLYQSHYGQLVRIAALLLGQSAGRPAGQPGPDERAELIVQDAFVGLHAAWQRPGQHGAALARLLQSVLAGTRAAARMPAACEPAAARGMAAAGPETAAGQAAVLAAVAALPAGQREALVLAMYADLPVADIAAAMGVSPAAAAGHLAGAKAALRGTGGA